MDSHRTLSIGSVSMTDLVAPDAGERELKRQKVAARRDDSAGEGLRAQTRARIGTGLALGTIHILIIGMRAERTMAASIALQVATLAFLYVGWASLVHMYL